MTFFHWIIPRKKRINIPSSINNCINRFGAIMVQMAVNIPIPAMAIIKNNRFFTCFLLHFLWWYSSSILLSLISKGKCSRIYTNKSCFSWYNSSISSILSLKLLFCHVSFLLISSRFFCRTTSNPISKMCIRDRPNIAHNNSNC